MKTTYFIMLLCLSIFSNAHANKMDVRSWAIFNQEKIDQLNLKIKKSTQNGESWVSDPTYYVHKLFGFFTGKEFSIKYTFDGAINPQFLEVRVIIDNINEGDSLRGLIYYVDLIKNDNHETWRVKKVEQSYRCWRTKNKDVFTEKACP